MNAVPFFSGNWTRPAGVGGGLPPTIAIDPAITSWAGLAALATVALPLNTAKAWVEAATLLTHVVVLRAGTDATDTLNGVQRPADYHGTTNQKVWFRASGI